MSDANLLALGGVVSFIAAAGFYIYLRECFAGTSKQVQPEAIRVNHADEKVRDVA